jgi:hypothetical protein
VPIDNFSGQPPRSPFFGRQQTQPSPTQISGSTGNPLVVNADGSLNAVPVLQSTDAFTETVVSISTTGDSTLVAGVAAKKIRLYRVVLATSTACSVVFKSAATPLTGAIPLATNGQMVLIFSIYPWLTTTAAADALVLNASTTASIGGWISYIQA